MSSVAVDRESVWMTAELPPCAPLSADVVTDVCVVGAGIAGLTVAYEMARAGQRVVVLDDGRIGGGQTQMTTAHLSNAIDDRYTEIERLHGIDGARLAADSHTAAIERIGDIVRREQIDCDFRRVKGYLFAPPKDESSLLNREFEAARRTGIVQIELVTRAPLAHFDTGPCLQFGNQAQFHPLKYLAGLTLAIRRLGGSVYTGTHVNSIAGGGQARVETTAGPAVTAGAVVVATNTPINDMFAIHTKQSPYMSYVIGARVPAGSVPCALYWDTLDPYHYVRVQPGEVDEHGAEYDVLIVGGEDHKTGHADDGESRYGRLEAWARKRWPMIESVDFHWCGQVMETIDGLAFIGRNPLDKDNVYIATGDSGMGMTHGTIAGMLLSDLILGRDNPWAKLYDPSRKTLGALANFAVENLDVAASYTSWLTGGEVDSADEIPRGHGAIVRRGLTKLAIYRDDAGRLTELSAVCPHLKCLVAWNTADRTWDCPCHGSRFDCQGHVTCGPANVDLPPAM